MKKGKFREEEERRENTTVGESEGEMKGFLPASIKNQHRELLGHFKSIRGDTVILYSLSHLPPPLTITTFFCRRSSKLIREGVGCNPLHFRKLRCLLLQCHCSNRFCANIYIYIFIYCYYLFIYFETDRMRFPSTPKAPDKTELMAPSSPFGT